MVMTHNFFADMSLCTGMASAGAQPRTGRVIELIVRSIKVRLRWEVLGGHPGMIRFDMAN